jgi:UDP-N-acetylmuramyl tripeptide synthase
MPVHTGNRNSRQVADPPRPSALTSAVLRLGSVAARASRLAGYEGQMIGGRLALMLRPDCLAELAAGRRVVLVSGTNGKTTTTAMLAAALGTQEPVASNASGANMLDGLTAALAESSARTAVGEVDELHLPAAARATRPEALVLLNFSRDQLDRASELREVVTRLHAFAAEQPDVLVVANCDDPNAVFAAAMFRRVVWVAVGTSWSGDAGSCPYCGYRLEVDEQRWCCPRCLLRRPEPEWALSGGALEGPMGQRLPIESRLPGEVNRINAALAASTAAALGVPLERAVAAVSRVDDVAGRYRTFQVGHHQVRLLLAKNPAGWAATLDLLLGENTPVVIAVNARQADGRDTSWLYDVDFERLAGVRVVVTGDRAADLRVRLSYAEVPHGSAPSVLAGVEQLPPGPVLVVGDYTSFLAARFRLEEQGVR